MRTLYRLLLFAHLVVLVFPSIGCAGDELGPTPACERPALPHVEEGVVGYAVTAHDEYLATTGCYLFDIYLEAVRLNDRSEAAVGVKHLIENTPTSAKTAIRSQGGIIRQTLPPGEYILAWVDDSLEDFGVPGPVDPTATNIRGAVIFTQVPSRATVLIARAGDPVLFFQLIIEGIGANPEAPSP